LATTLRLFRVWNLRADENRLPRRVSHPNLVHDRREPVGRGQQYAVRLVDANVRPVTFHPAGGELVELDQVLTNYITRAMRESGGFRPLLPA
jgi:hypothetical protein